MQQGRGGIILGRTLKGKKVKVKHSHYPLIADLVVEARGFAMTLVVLFGTPGRMPASLDL